MAGWESGPKRTPGTDVLTGVAAGAIGIGFWLPLSFHIIEDLSKDPSRPILLKLEGGHESTHVGDEFTISAIERYPDTFQRVNVSYEYYDLALSFEPNFGGDAALVAFGYNYLEMELAAEQRLSRGKSGSIDDLPSHATGPWAHCRARPNELSRG